MALKCDAILNKKLTGGLKNDIRILVNFHGAAESLKIFTLMGFFRQ